MAQIMLFKKQGKYVDKDGNERTATNFYVQCGDNFIPIEIKYFENKETKTDKAYSGRKAVLSAFASEFPAKTE